MIIITTDEDYTKNNDNLKIYKANLIIYTNGIICRYIKNKYNYTYDTFKYSELNDIIKQHVQKELIESF